MFEDSKKALELDPTYFKAYLRNGEACVEIGKKPNYLKTDLIEEGIKHL